MVISHLNKACSPTWKPGLNETKNNLPGHCILLFYPSERKLSTMLFWQSDAIVKKRIRNLALYLSKLIRMLSKVF